jgi:hypothetical protein
MEIILPGGGEATPHEKMLTDILLSMQSEKMQVTEMQTYPAGLVSKDKLMYVLASVMGVIGQKYKSGRSG